MMKLMVMLIVMVVMMMEEEEEEEEEETVWVFLLPRVLQKTVLGSRVNIGPH